MTLQQFLLILRARYKVALLTLLVTVATTTIISLLLPKQYTASAAVVVDVKSPDAVTGLMLQGMVVPSYMATQVDIINSDRVAEAVVKLLRMDSSTAIQQQWMEATEGKGQLIDWLATLLQRNVDVKPSRDSNVISINYSGTDPDFAAAVANAFAQAYISVNLDLRVARLASTPLFLTSKPKQQGKNWKKPSWPCLPTSKKTVSHRLMTGLILKAPSSMKPPASSPACRAKPPTAKANARTPRPTPWPRSCKARLSTT